MEIKWLNASFNCLISIGSSFINIFLKMCNLILICKKKILESFNISNPPQVRKGYILSPKTVAGLLILLSAVELFLGHRLDSLKYYDLS